MKLWKTVTLSAALAAAVGVGAAYAPVVYGQTRAPRVVTPRVPEVFNLAGGSRVGISIRDLDAEDVKGKVQNGVIVEEVDAESPAEKAGLKKGDVVVEFDGERVRSVRQFTRLVSETPAGRSVAAAVVRDGSRVSVNITPRDSSTIRFFESNSNWEPMETLRRFSTTPPTPPAIATRPARPIAPTPMPLLDSFFYRSGTRLGITTGELSPQLAEYFGAKDGVLVSAVENDSVAAKAGVKAGDVVTAVNGQQVDDAADLRREVNRVEAGGEFTLSVVREKKTITLKGKLDGATAPRRVTRTIL